MSTMMLEAHKVTLPLEETVLGIACFLVAWFLLLAPGSLDPNAEADFETGPRELFSLFQFTYCLSLPSHSLAMVLLCNLGHAETHGLWRLAYRVFELGSKLCSHFPCCTPCLQRPAC